MSKEFKGTIIEYLEERQPFDITDVRAVLERRRRHLRSAGGSLAHGSRDEGRSASSASPDVMTHATSATSYLAREGFERLIAGSDRVARFLLESLPTGVLVAGPDGLIHFVNQQLERIFGYRFDELVGQSIDILLPDTLRDVHARHRAGFMAALEARRMGAGRELYGRRKDGQEIPVEIGLNPISTADGTYVFASVLDISERRQIDVAHRRALEAALEFDRFVGENIATIINAPSQEVDDAVQDALRRVVEALDLDRGSLFRLDESAQDLVLLNSWCGSNASTVPESRSSGASQFPWSFAKLMRGEIAAFSSVDEIPDPVERMSVGRYATKSRVAIPIVVEGRVAGAIALASSREHRSWPPEILERLRLVALVVGGALARQRATAELRSSERRFRTLADAAPTLIWMSGPDKMRTWFNRQWLEFVGENIEHEVGAGWLDHVHPEDRDAWVTASGEAFDARRPFTAEYRLRRHDGEWRWMIDQGVPNGSGDDGFAGYVGACTDMTDQKRAGRQLEQVRDRLQAENTYLRREVKDRSGTDVIVGQSEAIKRVLAQVEHVSTTDATVLLLGETGTGKELFATRIHELSHRRGQAMVRINCSAIPATLIESELFGREKGAFTGALARQIGRFELADRSTIFLDEIGDLPTEVQVKLLRVLEERKIERLGSPRTIQVDTRIIAATHRNLEKRIDEGAFREDLFYRLNVFPIHVPPLRERREDISLLVWRFVDEFSKTFGRPINAIPRETMAALEQYPWPGNIRELRNVVERAMIVAAGSTLAVPLPATTAAAARRSTKLEDVEREHIRSVLETSGWRIRGTAGAADRLGMRPTTLETRMAKLGISRPKG